MLILVIAIISLTLAGIVAPMGEDNPHRKPML
jgi:hypothetical protein